MGVGPVRWQERFGPPGCLDGVSEVGDVVVQRADGVVAYHLATAVDELTLGISEVVRGADLWPATGAQVAVCQALGITPPHYGHVPLLCDGEGNRLSKRVASEGLAALRAQGLDAPGVIGLLAASGGLVPPGTRVSAEELLAEARRYPAGLDPGLRWDDGPEGLRNLSDSPNVPGQRRRQSV
jgi:glutamyl-tRNA synthetase